MKKVELDFLFCNQLYSYQDAVFDFLLAVLITKRSKNLIVKIRSCYQFELYTESQMLLNCHNHRKI